MTKRKASTALDNVTETGHSNGTHDNNGSSASAITVVHSNSSIIRQNGLSNVDDGQQVTSNNQNDNSNSNSSSNNINNDGSQQKSKKERADNWSSAEIQVLHRGIESRRDIFYGPPSQATKKNRELAWEAITKEVNSVSTTPRTLSQVMKKFKNEKCRAKRKFIDSEKDAHTNLSGNVSNFDNNGSTSNGGAASNSGDVISNLSAHGNNNQQHQLSSQSQQAHHMTTNDQMPASQPAINVVKLTPQNVAKTMIDLPGHVQQIQMPNDDNMVLIVPPEMDGLLSGMNIVSDALQGHPHNHHNQHAIHTLNTGQTLPNGQMTNGMMARTIPTASMCSLVYSTGGEVCTGSEQHLSANVVTQNSLSATNHIGVHAQNLMHHRVSIEQNQVQHQQHQQQQQQQQHQQQQQQQHQQQQQQQQQHHHQMHQQQQQPHPHPQQQQHPHHSQHQSQHLAPHQQQPHHLSTTATLANTGGVAVESQLKNLLINLLFKDGQHTSIPITNQSQNYAKQKNDILTTIASSLSKIEGHLDKLTKIAGPLLAQSMSINVAEAGGVISSGQLGSTNSGLNNSDRNNNSVNIPSSGNNISNQRSAEE